MVNLNYFKKIFKTNKKDLKYNFYIIKNYIKNTKRKDKK